MGHLKFDFHTDLHLGVAAEREGVRLREFRGRRTVARAARRAQRVLLPVEAPRDIFSDTELAKHMAARQRHGALAQVLTDRAREVARVVLVAEEVFFVDAHLCEVETLTTAAATSDGASRGVKTAS